MHFRLLVTFDIKQANNSEEARQLVMDALSNDPSFVGDGGLFGSPLADWFVIGGRWSGEITKALLDQKKLSLFVNNFENQYGWSTGGKKKITEKQRRSQALKMFKKHFPGFQGIMPYWRDTYTQIGAKDDAAILTEKLYNALLKEHEGEYATDHYVDLDREAAGKEMIGKKWLVICDYHS